MKSVTLQSENLEPVVSRKRSVELEALLRRTVEVGASDLHLAAGQRARWRVSGEIQVVPGAVPLGEAEVLELVDPLLDERHREEFRNKCDTDFSYTASGGGRFRVNLFMESRGCGVAFRLIPDAISSFEHLGLPAVTRRLCDFANGLVLVTGPTGSGKSTTLATMIDHINRTRSVHIITLEDPIEYVHHSRQSLVNQREVGGHALSFGRALRAAFREDPDVLLVGEMRDLETVELALEAANTGHLVFATLHTNSAASTVERMIGMFPAEQQAQVRATLADVLRSVVTQSLCRRIGGGRVVAAEVLLVNNAVSNLIREAKSFQIPNAMATSKGQGNISLNDELVRLVKERRVDFHEACTRTNDKVDLSRRLGMELPAGGEAVSPLRRGAPGVPHPAAPGR